MVSRHLEIKIVKGEGTRFHQSIHLEEEEGERQNKTKRASVIIAYQQEILKLLLVHELHLLPSSESKLNS